MFKKVKNVIAVIFSFLKFTFLKLLRWRGFEFGLIERFSPNTTINIWKQGYLSIGNKVSAHTGTKLSVTPGGIMMIDSGTKFNFNCILVAKEKIIIGKDVVFGPNVLVYDHDHDFSTSGGIRADKYITEPITIGNNSWIGAGSIILRGTQIGNNCVIGAGSVVKGVIPDNTVFVQKRESALRSIKEQ